MRVSTNPLKGRIERARKGLLHKDKPFKLLTPEQLECYEHSWEGDWLDSVYPKGDSFKAGDILTFGGAREATAWEKLKHLFGYDYPLDVEINEKWVVGEPPINPPPFPRVKESIND